MNDAKLYNIIRAPRVSEKTARLQEVSNQYVFEVSTEANKLEIKAAVEKIFDVKVRAVQRPEREGQGKAFKFRMGRRGTGEGLRDAGRRPVDRRDGHGLRKHPWH